MEKAPKVTKHAKLRSGCQKCKQRHLKCDETHPACLKCLKKGLQCPGYANPIKWSAKHEVYVRNTRKIANNLQSLQSDGEVISVPGTAAIREGSLLGTLNFDITTSDPAYVLGSRETNQPSLDTCSLMEHRSGRGRLLSYKSNIESQMNIRMATTGSSFNTEKTSLDYSEVEPTALSRNASLDIQSAWDRAYTQAENMYSGWPSDLYKVAPVAQSDSSSNGPTASPALSLLSAYQQSNYTTIASEGGVPWRVVDASGSDPLSARTNSIPVTISEDISSKLLRYYFSRTCAMNSCFDSEKNPFRTVISNLLHTSPLIRTCILSMSAAHMSTAHISAIQVAANKSELTLAALKLQTEAMSCLTSDVTNLSDFKVVPRDVNQRKNRSYKTEETLLGVILLGMSSSWHDPSALGLVHLNGARSLFKSWMCDSGLTSQGDTAGVELNQYQSFLVGIMSYWESLSSFLMDQKADSRNYLKPFCQSGAFQTIYPNPWTGISTPLYIWLAEVGTLIRQKRLATKIAILHDQDPVERLFQFHAFQEASNLAERLLSYVIPMEQVVESTGDPLTTTEDLEKIARIYRLTALLELYRAFPALIDGSTLLGCRKECDTFSEEEQTAARSVLLYDICLSILQIVQSIPEESGTVTMLSLPLLSAASGLQYQMIPRPGTSGQSFRRSLSLELAALRQEPSTVDRWRAFVRSRIILSYHRIGLDTIRWIARLVEHVWSKADFECGETMAASPEAIHWMDVMTDFRLETILG